MKPRANFSSILFGAFFLALILLGWGYDDLAGHFAHPARTISFLTMTIGFVIGMFLMPPNATSKGRSDRLVRRQEMVVPLATMVSILQHFLAPFSDRRDWLTIEPEAWLRYGGLLLFLIGAFYAAYAPIYLGKFFSIQATIQQEHKLITTGPFKRIRHPRYLGVILLTFGFALVYRSIPGLVLAALMTGLMIWRIGDEEKMMRSFFGEEWNAYAHRTGRLIPFIY